VAAERFVGAITATTATAAGVKKSAKVLVKGQAGLFRDAGGVGIDGLEKAGYIGA
jgi:hypothetical protein